MLQLQCIIKAKGRLGTPTSNGNGVQPKEAAAGLAVEEKARGRGKQRKKSRRKKKWLSDSERREENYLNILNFFNEG